MLAEDILLLITDPGTGKSRSLYTDLIVAGALLTELQLAGNVRTTEKGERVRRNRVVVVPEVPWPTDPALAEVLQVIDGKPHWNAAALVQRLSKRAAEQTYQRLALAEIVSRQPRRILGVFPVTRWPALDTSHEQRLLARLDDVLLFGALPDQHAAALIGLLSAADLVVKVIDRGRGVDRRAIKRRAKQLREEYWAAKAAYQAIQNTQAAAGG